jgi:mannose-6-phosphate isomerase
LDAAPESRIFAGLLPGVGPGELKLALESGTVSKCLHQFTPRPGDFIFLPAGTVHAVGGGVLFAEIQQTSDATFRLFDWNRRDAQGQPRQLHIEESLACIDWTRGPVQPLHVQAFAERQRDVASPLVQSPYFDLQFVRHTGSFALGALGQLQALCVFSGHGRLATGEVLQAGQVWVFPAIMPRTMCKAEPEVGGMLATLTGEWLGDAA